jgi:sterol desaturase/sphingolipid hydroxylase (fatty acid hydroxylase superfamily)
VDKLPNPTDYAIPGFVLLILIEMLWARRKALTAYELRDTMQSLMLGLGSSVMGFFALGIVYAADLWVWQFHLLTITPLWWTWILCFILDDLSYYGFHRAAHRIRWFWASHVNHHSSQHYNLSTALRQTWTGVFALNFIYWWPMILIGFPPQMVLFTSGLNLIYQFWIHTETIGRMPPWFEAVMNTPSHHRVHHAVNPSYLDRNYAGVFIIWDRMFGTFTPERTDEPCRYGVIKQLGGFNLLWGVFHEWVEIASDLIRAPLRSKWRYLTAPPGWSHDGSRLTSDQIRATAIDPQSAQ